MEKDRLDIFVQGNGEGQQRRGSVLQDQIQSVSDLVRLFIIDVLAILLPGMVFALAVVALIAGSGICFLRPFEGQWQFQQAFSTIKSSNFFASIPHVLLLAIFGYVLGATFFRQDPKLPDQKSLERILRDLDARELERSELPRIKDVDKEDEEKGAKGKKPSWSGHVKLWMFGILDMNPMRAKGKVGWKDAARIAASAGSQFPYSHISEYLEIRGFSHLAKIVPWDGGTFSTDRSNLTNRSKIFINMLKARIELVAPSKCGTIAGNEAHVRMMSSVWYASKSLSKVCWLSALPILFYLHPLKRAILINFQHVLNGEISLDLTPYEVSLFHDFRIYFALFLFTLITAFWIRRHAESCFHYQRVREVVYVLETAFSVDQIVNMRRSSNPEILENLPKK